MDAKDRIRAEMLDTLERWAIPLHDSEEARDALRDDGVDYERLLAERIAGEVNTANYEVCNALCMEWKFLEFTYSDGAVCEGRDFSEVVKLYAAKILDELAMTVWREN